MRTVEDDLVTFESVVEQARGAGAAVALVPPQVVAALGGLRQMRVAGLLNGVPFEASTFPHQGRELYVGLPKATRLAAGVDLGDVVSVELRRDDRPRVVELAPELEAALAAEPELRAGFEALSFSRRRELADPVGRAKRPETRAANVERVLALLRGGGEPSGSARVDEYIAGLPADRRATADELRRTIHAAVSGLSEAISYRMPAFKLGGVLVIWFAAHRDHYSLYPSTEAVVGELGDEIRPYLSGKGTIRFPAGEPLPLDLVRRIVQVRANEGSPYATRRQT